MSRPDKSTSKRRRAKDQDYVSMQNIDCRYQLCRRPTLEKGRGMRHSFCSKTHRDYFMANLADMFGNSGSGETADEDHQYRCKLPGCHENRKRDYAGYEYDFCRKEHALKYLEECTREWNAKGRLCQLQYCTHHVFVEESSKTCHDFCSFEHAKLAAAEKGRVAQRPQIEPGQVVVNDGYLSRSNGISQRNLSQETSQNLQHVPRNDRGYHVKLQDEDLEKCLRTTLLSYSGDQATSDLTLDFAVGVNIFEFHPWELVSGFKPRYFLFTNDANQSTQRSTKDGFGWKQTSSPNVLKGTDKKLQATYFWYEMRDKDSLNDHFGKHVRAYREYKSGPHRWRMYEYSLPNNVLEEVTAQGNGEGLRVKTVIWKIFQNPKGNPLWPSLKDHDELISSDRENLSDQETLHISRCGDAPQNCDLMDADDIMKMLTAAPDIESMFLRELEAIF